MAQSIQWGFWDSQGIIMVDYLEDGESHSKSTGVKNFLIIPRVYVQLRFNVPVNNIPVCYAVTSQFVGLLHNI